MIVMRNEALSQLSEVIEETGREISVAGRRSRGQLFALIGVTSFVLLAIIASAVASRLAAAGGEAWIRDLPGSRTLIVFGGMLVVGGAFMILRAAISHEEFCRRLDTLCRQLESGQVRSKELTVMDEETGLFNRRFFALRLEDEVSRYCRFNHPLSVVVLGVDDVKALGAETRTGAVEETLRGIGDILRRHSRSIDVIARSGSDEFAVLLVETAKAGALLYAERIRQRVETRRFGHGRAVTVSVGVACLPEDGGPVPEDLFATAEWALAEARSAGRNRVADRDGAVAATGGRRGGWNL